MAQAYRDHLTSAASLKTPYPAVRAGFVALALEKNRRATPHVDEARKLQAAALAVKKPSDLRKLGSIRAGLIAAAGISDKAANHLEETDKDEAITGLIETFLEPAGVKFAEELTFRFLLTRGDTLGGSMRNVGGVLATRRLTRSVISTLRLAGISYWWRHSINKSWAAQTDDDADIELALNGLSWKNDKGFRTLVYNFTIPAVKNNIDICLLDIEHGKWTKERHGEEPLYLALGELKGGIDPAGADEHWKTARTALGRIHAAFKKNKPDTFFIGAAIEDKMAREIWDLLNNGVIDNAANLTDEKQLASISSWLCQL